MKGPSLPAVPRPANPPTTANARRQSLLSEPTTPRGIFTSPTGLPRPTNNTARRTLLGGAV